MKDLLQNILVFAQIQTNLAKTTETSIKFQGLL